MKNGYTKYLCLAALCVVQTGVALAAPVTWATRPGTIAPSTRIAPATGAEALDKLTAPLSDEDMGLSSGINFSTSFDEDLLELRRKFLKEQEEAGASADDPQGEQSQPNRALSPNALRPGLRFAPSLNSVQEF